MLQWDISLGSQLCNKTDNRFILLLLMGPIGILEKKAGGKEQQKHVRMICFVPAHQFCCFQSDSHFKIQCFSYVSLDIYPFELLCKGKIQSRGIRRSYQLQSCQDFTFGVKLPIVLFLSKPWKPLWNISALELFCQRRSPKKHGKDFKKEKQMKPRLSRSLWKKLLSQKEVPEPCPGCCAWSHTSSLSAPLPEALGAKTYSCCTGWTKDNFFEDKRVDFPSSPSGKWLKLLSMKRWFGFPFNPILTLYCSPTESGEKSREHNTQETRSWTNSLGRSHGLEPGGCISQMSCLWCTPACLE